MEQLSMLDLMIPRPVPVPYEPPPRREFMTRAYGEDHMMEIGMDEIDPIEIVVRDIPTLIRFGFGWQTYTVQAPGAIYWSQTGFRSFGGPQTDPDEIGQMIDAHIDSKHGCNGKLTRWWPGFILRWRQSRDFASRVDRATTWDQFGPEQQAEHWAIFDAKQAEAEQRMNAMGFDPEEIWRSK